MLSLRQIRQSGIWQRFKTHRLGYWSLLIFFCICSEPIRRSDCK